MQSLYPPGHPVPDGLLRATTKQTVCVMYNDVSLQRVKKGFKQTADLRYVCVQTQIKAGTLSTALWRKREIKQFYCVQFLLTVFHTSGLHTAVSWPTYRISCHRFWSMQQTPTYSVNKTPLQQFILSNYVWRQDYDVVYYYAVLTKRCTISNVNLVTELKCVRTWN